MKKFTRSLLLSLSFLSVSLVSAISQDFNEVVEMKHYKGFFDFYYDDSRDRIYLEVKELNKEFLYVHSLSSGLGHNDIGLDRGQLGGEAVVYFARKGERLLLVRPNLDYRALTDNLPEQRSVEEAFATSVLYAFDILDHMNGVYLVDISGMLFSDAHHVEEHLADMNQGTYSLDVSLSGSNPDRTRAFPENVEFAMMLTFSGKPSGNLIREVAPDPHHVTVHQHHSFVKLPDDNYTPREFHPQSGCIPISYMDYSTPVYEPIVKKYIIRHRLEKKDPAKKVSKPVKPIVYYLDNGTPEPIRSALLEGGSWWNEAFRAIGFEDAFKIEMLPVDADPMDVRYNVIQWVHRSTRGWSYGMSVTDPRTGEIIKGHVSLGSLRVRQDFMIAQALMDRPFAPDDTNHQAMMDLALARIRQLSAHEIGHTLGFTHNFAASTNDRSSVMDYPHPLLTVRNNQIVMDDAYDEGIGAWDKVTVAYAYSDIRGNEKDSLDRILADARDKGLRFISDTDARAASGAHPYAHLWDNGSDAISELQNILEIRKLAMAQFSEENIRSGEPFSVLEDVFVPLYFFHRYQVEAVSKLVGGMTYSYSVKGDGTDRPAPLEGKIQQEAIDMLLTAISPEVLMIPEEKLSLFPPRAYGYPRTRESFRGSTGITFDPLSPPAAAADFTLGFLLHPARVNRLLLQHSMNPGLPGPGTMISQLLEKTIKATPAGSGYREEVMHTVNFILIAHLNSLEKNEQAYAQVRALARDQLNGLRLWLENKENVPFTDAYRLALIQQIDTPAETFLQEIPSMPPGSPIGMECMDYHR